MLFSINRTHEPVEIVAGAVVHVVFVVFHAEEIFTIVAAFVLKLIKCLQLMMKRNNLLLQELICFHETLP